MLDVLKALSGTSVPSLLMGLGGILLLLSFVQKIGTQIELPVQRQKLAAITGSALLCLGIGVTIAPALATLQESTETPNASRVPENDETTDPKTKSATLSSGQTDPEAVNKKVSPTSATADASIEPVYSQSLNQLMSDLSLLPADMALWDSEKLDIDRRLEITEKDKSKARRILKEANYSGLRVKYDSNCNPSIPIGEVRHAIFMVDRFDTASLAKAYRDTPSKNASPNLEENTKWHSRHDSGVSEGLGKCGGSSATIHWRGMRVGNMFLHAILYTSDRGPENEQISQLSEELVLSMAAKIPSFKP